MTATERPRSLPIGENRAGEATPLPRLLIAGGTGRLGSAVVRAARRRGLPRVNVLSRAPPSADLLDGLTTWYPPSDLSRGLAQCDVFVSASTSEAEEAQLPGVIAAGIPIVLATTGLSPAARSLVDRAAGQVPVIEEANFSPGIIWLERALRTLAASADYDIGLLEVHRRQKRDAPSATALRLGAAWSEGREASEPGGQVEISSLRLGDLPGFHQLFLAGRGEWIRIEHQAFDRDVFASGVLRAAIALHRLRPSLDPGRYRAAELWARAGALE